MPSEDVKVKLELNRRISGEQNVNAENRTHNLDHIDAIVQNALDTLGARTDETDVHARIDRELENTMRGIENLKITYEDCSVSTAKLDLILDKMRERRKTGQEEAAAGGALPTAARATAAPRATMPKKTPQRGDEKKAEDADGADRRQESEEEQEEYSSDTVGEGEAEGEEELTALLRI